MSAPWGDTTVSITVHRSSGALPNYFPITGNEMKSANLVRNAANEAPEFNEKASQLVPSRRKTGFLAGNGAQFCSDPITLLFASSEL